MESGDRTGPLYAYWAYRWAVFFSVLSGQQAAGYLWIRWDHETLGYHQWALSICHSGGKDLCTCRRFFPGWFSARHRRYGFYQDMGCRDEETKANAPGTSRNSLVGFFS